ncbi:ABC transporter substrate-binding protein [Ramlibacter sp. WS9]|uniref:ABC transporter substrate-binding protein n=1 Tax=Ramlibacter sp. WS9 TaxID=1882741 RepID=UPI0011435DFB|nr:ABC transporter substrate-binding protein [Ramlibacter sp. WS9]ROZ75761.1 ABC transporter substrate-binding protein [Ramlibacter sp. WS9]
MKRRTLVRSAGATAIAFGSALKLPAWGAVTASIKIGQSCVLSGPLGEQLRLGNRGVAMVFDAVNRSGGINGLPIELISLDDEFQPAKTLANCEQLLQEHRVVALYGLLGTGNLLTVLPLLEKTGVPVVGCIGVTDSAREKTRDLVYFVRAGYGREVQKTLQQITTIGIRRIALAHFNNTGGEEFKTVFTQSLQKLGMTPGVTTAVNVDGSNIAACATALAEDRPQAVVIFLAGGLPGKLIEAVNALGAFPNYYGMSVVPGELTAKSLGPKLRNLIITQVIPYPWAKENPALQAFRSLATAASVPVGYSSLEGYINASILVEMLKRAGKDLSPAKLHAALKRVKGRFGGLDVDFTGTSNTGSTFTELVYMAGDGKFLR